MKIITSIGLGSAMVIAVLVLLVNASAATGSGVQLCSVPTGPYPNIQSAIDDAGCDSIDVAAGIFVENLNISRMVAIHGQTASTTIVDGNASDSVFTIQPGNVVTLTEMTITNGHGFHGGGILVEDGSSVYLNNTLILSNSATSRGGGIHATLGSVIIYNSQLRNNTITAPGNGGALYLDRVTTVLSNSILANNTAPIGGLGGAILGYKGDLTILGSQLNDNSAASTGGAIRQFQGKLTIVDSALINNSSSGGGAIESFWTTALISDSLVKENTGSAIVASAGFWEIYSSQFLSNTGGTGAAITYGGGFTPTSFLIADSVFAYNMASGCGGAILNEAAVTLIISNTAFSHNSSPGTSSGARAGAICNKDSTLHITGSLLDNNFAGYIGGAIYNDDGIIDIVNSTLSGNWVGISQSGYGGAIFTDSELSIITMTNSTVSGNSTNNIGGGIYHAGWNGLGEVILVNTIVALNGAGGDCGGNPVISLGHNLDSDGSCNLTEPTDLPNADPLLEPLQDNGGSTWTHAIPAISPAIDFGDDAICPTTDQRGTSRPIDGDGDGTPRCDIGAFEYDGLPPFSFLLPVVIRP